MNKEQLKERLHHSQITYNSESLAVEYVSAPDGDSNVFHVEGRVDDYDEGWRDFEVEWDEEAQTFKAVDEDIELSIKLPTMEQIEKMEAALKEVSKKLEETKGIFKDLGFEKDMVFLHESSDLIEWNSSRC